jgi:uncharacterized protein
MFLERLQRTRPWAVLGVAFVLVLVSGYLALRLELKLRFEQLLPETRPSVIEMARLEANVRAGGHVFVLVEADDPLAVRAFGDAVVERLRKRQPGWLTGVSDGVHEAKRFLEPRAGMFVKLGDLQQLRDDIEARWSWEIAKQTGASVDDEPAPELSWDALKRRYGPPTEAQRFPDGYFQSKDGKALVVVVDTNIAAGDLPAQEQALAFVQGEVEAEQRRTRLPPRVTYAGDLVTGLAEYGAATQDLLRVGTLGIVLVLGVLLLYFRRLAALAVLAISLFSGLVLTFGLTEVFIGHLNVATGFLVSIVAGNGINFGIIYLARFYEERRQGVPFEQSLETARSRTWLGTLTAALAAAAAYGSLGVSEFRAFRDFALIGSLGMVVCWLSSYTLIPPLLRLLDRSPLARREPARPPGGSSDLRLPSWTARAVSLTGIAVALAGGVALVPYVQHDPLEYDMRRLQNNLGDSSADMYRAARLSAQILGAKLDGAMVLLADRPEQVRELIGVLEGRRDRAAASQKPFEAVHSAFDFVPAEQSEKLTVLRQIAARVLKARARGWISDPDFSQIAAYLPPDGLEPWGLDDLPAELARPFTDRAGQVGRLLLIEPTAGQSDADVKYLMRWADSFRSVKLSGGEVHGSGRAVIFADILATVLHDIPPTVLLAFGLTVATVLLTFRRGYQSLMVVASLVVGVAAVVLCMQLCGIKLNFFNFVALPVSFGIGVDYAVNLMQRYASEPERGVLAAVRGTGGAVLLCSATTILGYIALLASVNQAIRSLGMLAVLGELGCLAAATLVLPAWLLLRERRNKTSTAPALANPAE